MLKTWPIFFTVFASEVNSQTYLHFMLWLLSVLFPMFMLDVQYLLLTPIQRMPSYCVGALSWKKNLFVAPRKTGSNNKRALSKQNTWAVCTGELPSNHLLWLCCTVNSSEDMIVSFLYLSNIVETKMKGQKWQENYFKIPRNHASRPNFLVAFFKRL